MPINEKEKGLYAKYDVFKAGTNIPVTDCIVLKFSDPIATKALSTWSIEMKLAGYEQVYNETIRNLQSKGMIE